MTKNVILITIDCLRKDHLSCYDYERMTTPYIDYITSRGIKFENAFANGSFTVASFLSILSSAYPLDLKLQLPLSKDTTLISEILQKNGIKTAAIHSNPYLSDFYGYNRGWNYFKDFLDESSQGELKNTVKNKMKCFTPKKFQNFFNTTKLFLIGVNAYENAEKVTNYAMDWVNENKNSSFFLWFHYMDLHEPYCLYNTNIKRKFSNNLSRLSEMNLLKGDITIKNIKNIIDIYDDKLRYVDEQIKIFVSFLEKSSLMNNTLLIITSDHGQEFFDHSNYGHTARFYEEIIHIPLILSGPGIDRHITNNLVSQIDLPPTILNFFNIAKPEKYQGNDLLNNKNSEFIISEVAHNENGVYIMNNKIYPSLFKIYAIRTKRWKFICKFDNKKCIGYELYDLLNDPKEEKTITNLKVIASRCFKILQLHLSKRKKLELKNKIKMDKKILFPKKI